MNDKDINEGRSLEAAGVPDKAEIVDDAQVRIEDTGTASDVFDQIEDRMEWKNQVDMLNTERTDWNNILQDMAGMVGVRQAEAVEFERSMDVLRV